MIIRLFQAMFASLQIRIGLEHRAERQNCDDLSARVVFRNPRRVADDVSLILGELFSICRGELIVHITS